MAGLVSRLRAIRALTHFPNPTPADAPSRAHGGTRLFLSVVSILAFVDVLREKVYDYSFGHGESMLMTIPNEGCMTIFNRRYANGRGVKLGDLVAVRNPVFHEGLAGKRILGMPGDLVVQDKMYDMTVGGSMNSGLRGNGGKEALEREREEPIMVRVPEGHVWLVGDNLGGSRDSRYYGPVPMGLIVGKEVLMGDGWFDWTYTGGDWTHGKMEAVGKKSRVARGELVLTPDGEKYLSEG